MGVDHAGGGVEAGIGDAPLTDLAVVATHVLDQPVDRVVGVGALVDDLDALLLVGQVRAGFGAASRTLSCRQLCSRVADDRSIVTAAAGNATVHRLETPSVNLMVGNLPRQARPCTTCSGCKTERGERRMRRKHGER